MGRISNAIKGKNIQNNPFTESGGYLDGSGYKVEIIDNTAIKEKGYNNTADYIKNKIDKGIPVMMKTKGDNHVVNIIGYSKNEENGEISLYYNDTRNETKILTKRDITAFQSSRFISFGQE